MNHSDTTLYLGLDMHTKTTTIHAINPQGQSVKTHCKTLRLTKRDIAHHINNLAKQGYQLHLCFEASLGYAVFYDLVKHQCACIAVAHPKALAALINNKKKNNRFDAEKLARLCLLDLVPKVHIPPQHTRQMRELIEYRETMVDQKRRLMQKIKALLRKYDLKPDDSITTKTSWTKQFRQWLSQCCLDNRLPIDSRYILTDLLEQLSQIEPRLKKLEKRLDQAFTPNTHHPHTPPEFIAMPCESDDSAQRLAIGAELLKSIPGVGDRSAQCLMAYIDEAGRFEKTNQLPAYFGLVPGLSESAGRRHLGHVTKAGPASARRLIIQAAWQAIRRDAKWKAMYKKLRKQRGKPSGKAIVAVARRMLCVMAAMLKSGEVYRVETC